MTEKNKNPTKSETKEEIVEDIEKSGVSEKQAKIEEKLDEKATEEFEKGEGKKQEKDTKKKEIRKEKKTEAFVNGRNVSVSTKQSMGICRFIKGKRIGDAIRDLEEVAALKKAVPMKGEHPHRKGRMSSGKFPQKAAKNFIVLLKSLAGNSGEMDDPVIVEAIANFASRPYGRFGRTKKKRTNIKIIVKESKPKKEKNKAKKLEKKK